ncbi:MAG: hypothetical protein HC880_03945 [Bacteroidia bacterium]|nr:hypothetical protein [Bacteroidia bacterium]
MAQTDPLSGSSPFDDYKYRDNGVIHPLTGDSITGTLLYSFLEANVYLETLDEKGKIRREKYSPKQISGFRLDTLGGKLGSKFTVTL